MVDHQDLHLFFRGDYLQSKLLLERCGKRQSFVGRIELVKSGRLLRRHSGRTGEARHIFQDEIVASLQARLIEQRAIESRADLNYQLGYRNIGVFRPGQHAG